jgi:hypothetical protein
MDERNTKQATRKQLGMHVLLIEVEERNSEGKIPSILVNGEGKQGKEFSQGGLRRDGQRIVLVHQSEETYVWSHIKRL